MPNRRPFDHLTGAKFRIEIEGVTQGAFTAVDGLEATVDVVTFADGSDLVVRKRPGRVRYSNLVLRRGYLGNDELWEWFKRVADGRVERRSGSIILTGDGRALEASLLWASDVVRGDEDVLGSLPGHGNDGERFGGGSGEGGMGGHARNVTTAPRSAFPAAPPNDQRPSLPPPPRLLARLRAGIIAPSDS